MAQQVLEPGQQVNRVGKYMYKHIDGAYKIKFSGNECDVLMFMYYQKPREDDIHEMRFDINITTYSKKIRVNVVEMTSMEKTIGHSTYSSQELMDLKSGLEKIYKAICHQIEREYQDYDFIF